MFELSKSGFRELPSAPLYHSQRQQNDKERKTTFLTLGPPQEKKTNSTLKWATIPISSHLSPFSLFLSRSYITSSCPHPPHPPGTLRWLALPCTRGGNPARWEHQNPARPKTTWERQPTAGFVNTPERLGLWGASVWRCPKISTRWCSYPNNPFLGNRWLRIEKCDFCFHCINWGLSFRTFTRHGSF